MTRRSLVTISIILISTFQVLSQNIWRKAASANQRRVEAASLVYNHKLYVFHGYNPAWRVSHTSEVYDPQNDTWTELAPLPSGPRSGFTHNGIALVEDEVWLVGGKSGWANALFDKVWIYNITHDSWRQGPSLPLNLGTPSLIKLGRTLHLFGGGTHPADKESKNGNFCILTNQYYTLDLNDTLATWEVQDFILPKDVRRIHQGTVLLNGLFYIMGGQRGHDCGNTDLTTFFQFDPATKIWTQLPDLPVRASHIEPCTFPLDGDIYIASGERADRPGGFILKYDIQDSTWTVMDSIRNENGEIVELIAPSAKVIDDLLIVSHGFGYGRFYNETFIRDFPRDTTIRPHLGFHPATIQANLRYGTDSLQRQAWLWTNEGKTPYELALDALPDWLSFQKDTNGLVDESAIEFKFNIQNDSLLPGTYTYEIKAKSPTHDSTVLSISLEITLDAKQVPVAPQALRVRSNRFFHVDLAWELGSNNTDGYIVYRRADSTQSFDSLAYTKDTFWLDESVQFNTYYEYLVKAFNKNGFSPPSNLVQLSTPPYPPQRPRIKELVVRSATQIDISWETDSLDYDFFQVYRADHPDSVFIKIANHIKALTYQDQGLEPNTTYYYKVRARNAGGPSFFTKPLVAATTFPLTPNAPSGLTAQAVSSKEIMLNWEDNSDNETSFQIFRSVQASGGLQKIAEVQLASYTDSTLKENTIYYYRVRATNLGQHSTFSNLASDTTFVSLTSQPPSSALEVYPNPSEGMYTLNLTSPKLSPIFIVLSDSFGNTILQRFLFQLNSWSLDIRNYPDGLYYLQIIQANKVYTQTLLKK